MEAHQDDDVTIMEEMKSHIKGKRSKRRRPSSALTLNIASATTTTITTGSPANPSGFFQMPSTTSIDFTNILQENDDEDMANCLILLAHGHHLPAAPPSKSVGPPPLYVYECKTCNRGFTSFQALGGHRASHNKPHKDVHDQPSRNRASLSIGPNKYILCSSSGSSIGPKVHGCSICGSEFTSGQALGGHMRRHRSIAMIAPLTTATETCSTSGSGVCHESKKHKTLLQLDLNLPAPMEDDHRETKYSFDSNSQMIVFSATSLVDCHF